MLCVNVSLVPVMVKVKLPAVAATSTDTVNLDVAEPLGRGVTETKLKVVVTPVGAPETERATDLLKPFIDMTVMVELPELPWTIISEEGDVDNAKSGAAVTVRLMLTLCVLP